MKWVLIFYLVVSDGSSGHTQQTQLEFNTEAQCLSALTKLSEMPKTFYKKDGFGIPIGWGNSITFGRCIKSDLKK